MAQAFRHLWECEAEAAQVFECVHPHIVPADPELSQLSTRILQGGAASILPATGTRVAGNVHI
ncbi:hypothetical protein GCM10010178_67370 [Lentzea flava]|uniref:Uncharacterized protein n=1 Tax=Lentzea flava TaxID=103732 RepID=A0ABQ2V2X7_9PSEU|nr:hypothetical protein GCM10010178_67370 [Lentzea flava]